MVQTCVVASYSLAFAGGFGCYLLSMDHQTFTNLGPIAGNRPQVSIHSRPAPEGVQELIPVRVWGLNGSWPHRVELITPHSMVNSRLSDAAEQ